LTDPKKHILVVDDEPTWIKVLRYFLESRGYDVQSVESATEALSALRTYHPDLILTDVRMPEMNGFDLLAHIRTMPDMSKTPVVFFSAIDDYDARKTARDLGAADYIVKPFDQDEVASVLHKHLRIP
jgi:two-component system, sensor histidine kinase and response regulator